MRARVQLGIDILQRDNFARLRGRRVGLLTTFAATDRSLRRTYDLFRTAEHVRLTALFSPEHGLSGAAREGAHVASSLDDKTGLPIHSLYGDTLRPTADMLSDVDAIVCDIPDVGARYYTYIWTLRCVIEAARDIEIIVLDRPNPIDGRTMEGGGMEPALRSIVGGEDIPIRHGLTVGELAQLIAARQTTPPTRLTVIRCEGWRRAMPWSQTGLYWSPPSPNMPRLETVLHYPGACLVEGTNLSEGRGTPLPFEVVGAPFIDEAALESELYQLGLPGVLFRAHTFTPSASKWAGEVCRGVQVYPMQGQRWRPVAVWLHILATIWRLYPRECRWLPPHNGAHHFDRLIGTPEVRQALEAGDAIAPLLESWRAYVSAFRRSRLPFLLYD